MDRYYIRFNDEKLNIFLNSSFGVKEIKIENNELENIDNIIDNIKFISNGNKVTIYMSNEIASFSSNLTNKYKVDKNVKIIII